MKQLNLAKFKLDEYLTKFLRTRDKNDITKDNVNEAVDNAIKNNRIKGNKGIEVTETNSSSKYPNIKSQLKTNSSGFDFSVTSIDDKNNKLVNQIKTSNSTLTVNAVDLAVESKENISAIANTIKFDTNEKIILTTSDTYGDSSSITLSKNNIMLDGESYTILKPVGDNPTGEEVLWSETDIATEQDIEQLFK